MAPATALHAKRPVQRPLASHRGARLLCAAVELVNADARLEMVKMVNADIELALVL
jgi:hypothetical protein